MDSGCCARMHCVGRQQAAAHPLQPTNRRSAVPAPSLPQVLYNTSTHYDDLAWGAGWLYKATKQVRLGWWWGGRGAGKGGSERLAPGWEGHMVRSAPAPCCPTGPPALLMLMHPFQTNQSLCAQDSYLADVYDFYMKHLEDEAPISDFK